MKVVTYSFSWKELKKITLLSGLAPGQVQMHEVMGVKELWQGAWRGGKRWGGGDGCRLAIGTRRRCDKAQSSFGNLNRSLVGVERPLPSGRTWRGLAQCFSTSCG